MEIVGNLLLERGHFGDQGFLGARHFLRVVRKHVERERCFVAQLLCVGLGLLAGGLGLRLVGRLGVQRTNALRQLLQPVQGRAKVVVRNPASRHRCQALQPLVLFLALCVAFGLARRARRPLQNRSRRVLNGRDLCIQLRALFVQRLDLFGRLLDGALGGAAGARDHAAGVGLIALVHAQLGLHRHVFLDLFLDRIQLRASSVQVGSGSVARPRIRRIASSASFRRRRLRDGW